ncbi:MAG: efflux RND transporter periplasmic adaptor subunit [Bacteroidales bacterium]|nr:efflux RND transporter periplasmic adaptor subunit [Bacteroidales bacterium]
MSDPVATMDPPVGANGTSHPHGTGHHDRDMLDRVQQLRLDNQLGGAKSARTGSTWLPWILCGVLALTWASVAIRSYRNPTAVAVPSTNTAIPQSTGESPSAPPSPTAPVAAGTVQLEVKGYLVPAQQIAVSPIEVGGLITELNVIEGKLFPKGAVLAKIDDTSYRTAAAEAEATYAAAKMRLAELLPSSVREIELDQVEGELEEAKASMKRAEDILKRLRSIRTTAAEQELVQAETDFRATSARVDRLKATLEILKEGPRPEKIKAAEAEVRAAQARVDQANWRLGNCIIKAPITGTVLTKKAELGNLVNPLAFAATSGSVCDIADLADLEVDLEIPERDIRKLAVGQPCRLRADAYPDKLYNGILDRIMPIANRAKSVVNVRVKVRLPTGEVPGTYLKPEMGVVVSFLPMPGLSDKATEDTNP